MVSRGIAGVKVPKCKANVTDLLVYEASRRQKLAQQLAGAPERTPHVGAIEILAQVHEREESAKDPGLQIIRKRQTAGGHAGQSFAMFGDKFHDFALALVRRIAQRRLSAHPRATIFHRQSKMQHAHLVLT
jgi:hypothetical protein